jgi:hypothetical protein
MKGAVSHTTWQSAPRLGAVAGFQKYWLLS